MDGSPSFNFEEYHRIHQERGEAVGRDDSCFEWDVKERGDVWISQDRRCVEWFVDDQCIRRLHYEQPVIKAGFVDFTTAPNCFVIILRDVAHVYFLSNGDSTTVCFPFCISDAFWYSQGVVLVRESGYNSSSLPEGELQHKFITFSDPMAPFGFITFSPQQKNIENPGNLQMLVFPRYSNHNITVLFDVQQWKLHFYYTQVLTGESEEAQKKGDHGSAAVHSSDPSKNLRKMSILNRRVNSTSLSNDVSETSQMPTDSLAALTNNNRPSRSTSATVDRMSGSTTSAALEFSSGSTQQQQLQQNELLNQAISSKDVKLTRISSMTLPQHSSDVPSVIKCVALRFQDQEAVAIFDPKTHFSKVWMIDLLPDVIYSLSFKVYGDSPQDLIKLSDFDIQGPISDILPYRSRDENGLLAVLLHSKRKVCLYNPFVKLESPQHPLFDDKVCHISENRMVSSNFVSAPDRQVCSVPSVFPYPQMSAVKLCLEAMKWICTPSVLSAVLFLWQYVIIMRELTDNSASRCSEFAALEFVLTSLISTLEDEVDEDLFETTAFQLLRQKSSNSLIPEIIMGLHLVREELALNVLAKKDVENLGNFLYFATSKMSWPIEWRQYYKDDDTNAIYTPLKGTFAHPLDEPPSILKSLYSVTANTAIPTTPFICFSRLAEMDSHIDQIVTPRTFKSLRLYELTRASNYTDDYLIEILTKLDIGKEEIETFPLGMLTPLSIMLEKIEKKLSQANVNLDLSVISRPDLERCALLMKQMRSDIDKNIMSKNSRHLKATGIQQASQTEAKDLYTILSDVVKSSRQFSLEKGPVSESQSVDDFDEGSTLKKNAGLIFSEDRRLNYVLSLLIYYKPSEVQFFSLEINYRKILKQKRAVAKNMTMRTCTSGIGFGAVAYATEKPLATQKWTRPQMNFTYLFPDGTKISLQQNELNKEVQQWGEFHGGVSSGLRISKKAKGINGSWIAFSKPNELDAQHGGFLLGLGLNGHLTGLEEWHVYNYLSPKKTFVSIGLLLGMSASMRGTMDLKLTKVLSVHSVAFLPPGSSDLNINLKVQTAGLIGIGLLYQRSQHRRMSDVLFSQLSSFVVVNEEPISDEGYRLASGIALGLINIGAGDIEAGKKLLEEEDSDDGPLGSVANGTGPDERIIVGLLQLVTENHDVEEDWIPENSQTSATVALMLIFLKTNNTFIANMIRPDYKQASNLRPDLFMFREWAYHMIVWSNIDNGLDFILESFDYRIKPGITTDNLPIYYTMAGRALAMGIKYASTGNVEMRDSLVLLVDRFLPFYQYPGDERLDFKLAIIGINTLVNVLIVSVSMIMCGTGDLTVLRRIRYLREVVTGNHSDLFRAYNSRTRSKKNPRQASNETGGILAEEDGDLPDDAASSGSAEESGDEDSEPMGAGASPSDKIDEENYYGKFLASNLSLGFLFLGSGQYALKTSTLESIAYLIITALPTYVFNCPLQETKHFWSMAVEPRCLVVRDATTEAFVNNVPFELSIKVNESFDETKNMTAPCLLPDIRRITSIKIDSEGYYPFEVRFDNDLKASEFFKNGTILYIQPKRKNTNSWKGSLSRHEDAFDIHSALGRKVNALASSKARNSHEPDLENMRDKLASALRLNDVTMTELKCMNNDAGLSKSAIYAYDFDMLCSDGNNCDVNDYQLEMWRKKHNV